jgi:hypothetical protein
MTRIVILSIAAFAVLLDGYVHGLWTDRWGNARVVERAVTRLERVPMTVGDWQAHPKELGTMQAKLAGYAGYWQRAYQRDGMMVTVMLACGRPGPLSVHTPETCYAAQGFVPAEEPVKYVHGGENGGPEFWKARFTQRDAAAPRHLRLYWSWRTADGWRIARNPRWEFASQPVLYKMYITYEMSGTDAPQEDAACTEFMSLLLSQLDQVLAAPS